MKNILNSAFFYIIISITISCNKKIFQKNENCSNIYIDSLKSDFNADGKVDILKIRKVKNQKLNLLIFDKNSKIPTVEINNIIFDIGDLQKNGTDFLHISWIEKSIIITQEFGITRPDGWFICYISSKKNKYLVDSIAVERKNYQSDNDRDFIIRNSKKIDLNIEQFNKKPYLTKLMLGL